MQHYNAKSKVIMSSRHLYATLGGSRRKTARRKTRRGGKYERWY